MFVEGLTELIFYRKILKVFFNAYDYKLNLDNARDRLLHGYISSIKGRRRLGEAPVLKYNDHLIAIIDCMGAENLKTIIKLVFFRDLDKLAELMEYDLKNIVIIGDKDKDIDKAVINILSSLGIEYSRVKTTCNTLILSIKLAGKDINLAIIVQGIDYERSTGEIEDFIDMIAGKIFGEISSAVHGLEDKLSVRLDSKRRVLLYSILTLERVKVKPFSVLRDFIETIVTEEYRDIINDNLGNIIELFRELLEA